MEETKDEKRARLQEMLNKAGLSDIIKLGDSDE
jgi:hypothetical protein